MKDNPCQTPAPTKQCDLWRLLGQRQAINEICQWHLAQVNRLSVSDDLGDRIKALWHLQSAEMMNEMESVVSAQCREREAAK